MRMYVHCGKCGREMTAIITEINNYYLEIAYYCEACKKTMAYVRNYFER